MSNAVALYNLTDLITVLLICILPSIDYHSPVKEIQKALHEPYIGLDDHGNSHIPIQGSFTGDAPSNMSRS